ncbi:MAG: hypothetical protein EHM87_14330 [Burkholderiales bacterium]|nr:MAG: hypothetical protein EHM87_14330 [Burkholderiales bacterium]
MAANIKIFPAASARSVAQAVAGAPLGGKAAAGLTRLSTEVGASYRQRLIRSGVVVADMAYTGTLPIVGSAITLPAFTALNNLSNADIDTGVWVMRVGRADDSVYVEGAIGRAGGSAPFVLTGDLSTTKGINNGPVLLRFPATLDGVATPPAAVATWLVRSTDTPVVVPADYLGVHSDYRPGATYPVNPNVQSSLGAVRSLDHDPSRGYFPALSWWALEPTPGVFATAAMDAWVSHNTGKRLLFVVDRTPAFYQDPALPSSYSGRYPSYTGASAPPADPLKMSALIKWILTRYPTERWLFSLANEPNFSFNDGALSTGGARITSGNRFDVRWDDTFAAAMQAAGRYPHPFSATTPRKLANAYKIVKQDLVASGFGQAKLATPGWEGQHADSISNSFRRWAECPTDGGGVGADWADEVEYHYYSYNRTDSTFLTETNGIINLTAALGMGSKPILCSEAGLEIQYASGMSNEQQSQFFISLAIQGAARGIKSMVFYKFSSESDGEAEKTMKYNSVEDTPAKVAANAARRADFAEMAVLNGATIVQAAVLSDGRKWAALSNGLTLVR